MIKWVILGYCWWYSCKFCLVTFIKVIWGEMTSSEVTNIFLLISHAWKKLQTWAWSHWACLVKTHRLICNMTYLGQHMTFVWPWPEVQHWPYPLRSLGTCFDAPQRQEHDGCRTRPLALWVQKLFAEKNLFAPKSYFDVFLSPSA